MPATSFARSVGLREKGRFLALVSVGHTPATRMKNPKNGAIRVNLTKAQIDASRQRFLTLTMLVDDSGEHRNTILARLKEAGVRPFSPGGKAFGHLYLREELEGAFSP
jgi:hypothetical protein